MSLDAQGSLAAFTIGGLPPTFQPTSLPGIAASIPRATVDPGTLPQSTTASLTITSELEIGKSWSDRGAVSVYTEVRTTGTPRVAVGTGPGPGTVSNRLVSFYVREC